jgi:glycosyltransferase involved in cell wall biosynthesis
MEKIRVLQVNKLYYPEIGGIEKTLQQISEGLQQEPDVDLKVLVCQKKGKGQTDCVNGVTVHRSGSFGVLASVPISLSFFANLRKMSKNCDVVQFHMPFPLGDLACLLSGYRGKVAAFWHSDVVKQKKWMVLYRPVMELFLKRADVILVGAQGILEGSKYLKPYRDKCRVVPFAVTDEILHAGKAYLDQHGYQKREKQLHFLFIGRLVYYKGCSVLLDAFAKAPKDAILTLVGDGALRKELEQQAKILGISDRVRFLGRVENCVMQQCMEDADVFVLPSIERSEAFALVQLEAMAYGIPVINTNLPSGVPEVSIHGETGLTVEPGDAEELAEAMNWMSENPEQRLTFGIAARKRLEERFTQELLVQNMKAVYRELINGNHK